MIYTKEVENMCPVAKGAKHEPAPIPEEGKWVHSKNIEDISGYVTGIALDENNEVIGYQFVSLGKMTDFIKKGDDPNTAWEKAKGQYGRVDDAVKIIDPRQE